MSVRREEEPVVVRELLEPRLSLDQKRERVVHSLLTTKPEITRISRSSVLDEVRTFLPRMAEAEGRLNKAIREGLADSLNIQNIDGLERVVEMDVALLKEEDKSWTSDSEPDSTPSQTENDFTSDSDSSSVSDQESPARGGRYAAPTDGQRPESRKRPLVEEMEPLVSPKSKKDQS